jgi:hypothetical protein
MPDSGTRLGVGRDGDVAEGEHVRVSGVLKGVLVDLDVAGGVGGIGEWASGDPVRCGLRGH